MPLESGDYINDLVITNPLASDAKSFGDDHFRLVKKVLKECLNGFTGGILLTATESGTAAAHVLTPTTALVSYTTGLMLLYRPTNAGTGALTVNVSALGAKSVKTIAGADPTSGDILANQPILLVYDGTNFVLLAGSEYLSKTGSQTLTGNLTLTGNQTVSGTLGVTGAATVGGTLGVTGALTVTGDILGTGGDKKADKAGSVYTGTHDFSGATSVLVPAATLGGQAINLTQLTATAFSSALPSQTGNAGKFVTTDGTNASWALPIADQTGNNGKFLTTDGSTTSWGTVATPGLVFISTATASGVATVDITGLSSTYSEYLLICTSVIPATDAVDLLLRTSTDGGSSFDSGAGNYRYGVNGIDDASNTISQWSASATSIKLSPQTIGNVATEGISVQIRIHKPSAAQDCQMNWSGSCCTGAGVIGSINGAGKRTAAADVDAIRLLFSSGNVASGEFKLYGFRAS